MVVVVVVVVVVVGDGAVSSAGAAAVAAAAVGVCVQAGVAFPEVSNVSECFWAKKTKVGADSSRTFACSICL